MLNHESNEHCKSDPKGIEADFHKLRMVKRDASGEENQEGFGIWTRKIEDNRNKEAVIKENVRW